MENPFVAIIMVVVLATIALRNVYVGVHTLNSGEYQQREMWHRQPPILLGIACALGAILFLLDFSVRRNGAYPSTVWLGIELALALVAFLFAVRSWMLLQARRRNL